MSDATTSADKNEINICIPSARPNKALAPTRDRNGVSLKRPEQEVCR